MYKHFIKTLLFFFNVERAHRVAIAALRIFGRMGGGTILRSLYQVKHPSLEREVLGLHFSNPIGLAAGFDINGEAINELKSIGFGFVEIGSITPQPQIGNPRPHSFRLSADSALIERTGYPNQGWRQAIKGIRKEHKGIVVGCNLTISNEVTPEKIESSYLESFRNLYQYSDYFTINVSSGSAAAEESHFTSERIEPILKTLFEFRRGQSEYRPILLKVSPDLSDETLARIAEILMDTPLDGVVAIMGSYGRAEYNLKSNPSYIQKIGNGRLSGTPIAQRALEVVRLLHKATNGTYPIIGVGGVSTAEDVQAMLDAGASLVQIHTSFFRKGPSVVKKICNGLVANVEAEANVKNESVETQS